MNVVAIIQARTGSTRLPNKVLMKVNKKSILEQIIDSLKYAKQINKIIVATTTLSQDDTIEKLARNLEIECYRGSVNDVLGRYYECAKKYHADIIIRITADDPIVIPELIDEVVQICKETKYDYVTNLLHQTFPIGICVEAFPFSILKDLHENAKDDSSREHVTQHILDNPELYRIKEVTAPKKLTRPNWRLTVDYVEDMLLMKEIFSRLYKNKSLITYKELVEFLDENKKFLEINTKHT